MAHSLFFSIQILFFPVHFLIFSYNLNYKYGKKYLFLILILLILFFSQFFFYKIISIEALYNVTAERLGDFKNQFKYELKVEFVNFSEGLSLFRKV